ncbi:MAG: DUF5681 domain-containing protein [Alphaproteobacteria bacterium]
MSKKKCTDGRKNNRPPKEHQFKPGQSGNPKGRPKEDDRMKRFSMNSFRSFIMNDAHKLVEIVENGRRKMVPKFYVIVSQLNNKAAKGDVRATALALKYLQAAASGNDAALFDWIISWSKLQERKLKASCDPGSLEHYDVMYDYFMFKRDMRRGEGVEAWPYENDEPYDDKDWKVFLRHHEKLKSDRLYEAPWPPKYPSDDPANE